MLRKPIFAMFCILCLGPVWSASGDLVGWGTFEETAGNVAAIPAGTAITAQSSATRNGFRQD